jgi:hypothetical protein
MAVQSLKSNVRRPRSKVKQDRFTDIGPWRSNAGLWTLNLGRWTLDKIVAEGTQSLVLTEDFNLRSYSDATWQICQFARVGLQPNAVVSGGHVCAYSHLKTNDGRRFGKALHRETGSVDRDEGR